MRFIVSFFIILFLSSSAAAYLAWQDFTLPSKLAQETTIILPRGSGFIKSMEILAENKIISHPLPVKIIAYITGYASNIKAGEYSFSASISPKEVLKILAQGKVVRHKITFAEGLNLREMLEILRADNVLEGDITGNIDEGSLFPETYYFIRGDTRASIIARMQEKMRSTINELWEKREDNLPIKDKNQALILASIVEKETGLASERTRVAGIFINRLNRGMRLQSDPTVVYGIEKNTGKPLGRTLTISDLKTLTLYNTYVIDSLPLTPIANPSRASIEAVLHPLKSDELYFVATGDGGHNFASTLADHNKNVQKYRESLER